VAIGSETITVTAPESSISIGRDSITVQFVDRSITNSVPYSYADIIACDTGAACTLSTPTHSDMLRFTLLMGGVDHDRLQSYAADIAILVGDDAHITIPSSLIPARQQMLSSHATPIAVESFDMTITSLQHWDGMKDGSDMIESMSSYNSRTIILGGGGSHDKVIHHGWNGDVFICADYCFVSCKDATACRITHC
jgi:hypothetical protein